MWMLPLKTHKRPKGGATYRFSLIAISLFTFTLIGSITSITPKIQAQAPEWSQGLIWYQIFPERFRNGDSSNDPNRERARGPEGWHIQDWGCDWYARAEWETEATDRFYDIVRERRYGGDLQGVIDKLDYLKELGVGGIYFNPVFDAQSMHKYDATFYHHIDRNFGPNPSADVQLFSEEDPSDPKTWQWSSADSLFLKLIREAHSRGMRVIIDGVFNHTGTEFWAFQHVIKHQQNSPFRHWYNILSYDDPETIENEFDYEGWWGFKGLPIYKETAGNLHPDAKAHIFAVTQRWMDPNGDGDPSDGVDGWRLDVASEVGVPFWREWHEHVRSINPDAYTSAEIWDQKALDYVEDSLFSSVMNYPFAFAAKGFFIDQSISSQELSSRLLAYQKQFPAGYDHSLQNLYDSHDTPRIASLIKNPGAPYNPDRYPDDTYSLEALDDAEFKLLTLMVGFQFSWTGAPMVYYGTEAGMWGADDPDDRKPMVWPDIAFEPEQNHPYGLERKADSVGFNHRYYELFQSLAQIRNSTKALQRGDLEVLPSSPNSLVFLRSIENEQVLVIINRGDTPEDIPIHRWETTRGKWSLLYSSTRKTPQINKEEISGQAITIAPLSFSIYHRN